MSSNKKFRASQGSVIQLYISITKECIFAFNKERQANPLQTETTSKPLLSSLFPRLHLSN